MYNLHLRQLLSISSRLSYTFKNSMLMPNLIPSLMRHCVRMSNSASSMMRPIQVRIIPAIINVAAQ